MPRVTPRLPIPDVARGFMLLLIAVANVATWMPVAQLTGADTLDRAWVFIRTLLIDARSYPLFSMLFGFGLATVAARYDDPKEAGRVLRRRGWWLMAFGLAHAILFPGDVLGAYGLLAVVLSGLIAARRRGGLITGAVIVGVLSTAMFFGASLAFDDSSAQGGTYGTPDILTMSLLNKLQLWLGTTVGGAFLTAVLPCVGIGVFIQHSGILAAPWRHRRRLALTATGGLGLAALLGLPAAFAQLDDVMRVGGDALHGLGSYPGGLGWLALIALVFAGRARSAAPAVTEHAAPPPVGRPSAGGAAGLLAAIGKRSLTAYLSQTLLFAPLFFTLHSLGLRDSLTPAAGAGIAMFVWLLAGVFCVALERAGRRGPFETLNRRLVGGKRRQVTASSDAAV